MLIFFTLRKTVDVHFYEVARVDESRTSFGSEHRRDIIIIGNYVHGEIEDVTVWLSINADTIND